MFYPVFVIILNYLNRIPTLFRLSVYERCCLDGSSIDRFSPVRPTFQKLSPTQSSTYPSRNLPTCLSSSYVSLACHFPLPNFFVHKCNCGEGVIMPIFFIFTMDRIHVAGPTFTSGINDYYYYLRRIGLFCVLSMILVTIFYSIYSQMHFVMFLFRFPV